METSRKILIPTIKEIREFLPRSQGWSQVLSTWVVPRIEYLAAHTAGMVTDAKVRISENIRERITLGTLIISVQTKHNYKSGIPSLLIFDTLLEILQYSLLFDPFTVFKPSKSLTVLPIRMPR